MNRAGQRGGQRVLVGGERLVILLKGLFADRPDRRLQQRTERRMAELNLLAALGLDLAEFQIGIVQLAEDLPGGAGHLGLHGQQFFLAGAERVGLVAQDSLQDQPVGLERLAARNFLILAAGISRISGRM